MPLDTTIPGTSTEWLERAHSNLALAKVEKPDKTFWEDLCFNAQQAAEKALKAVLQDKKIVFRYIHDLDELLKKLRENGIEITDEIKPAILLTHYASTTRYPGHFEPATEEDYRKALSIAERVVAWAEANLGRGKAE